MHSDMTQIITKSMMSTYILILLKGVKHYGRIITTDIS